MQVTLISPYHGGSHQAWAEGFQQHSQHDVQLLTLPARFWKWRMHGAAVTLARHFDQSDSHPDLLLATDMLDLRTFLALTRRRTANVPAVLYMHENQLTYPLPRGKNRGPMRRQRGERDLHYVFINYASMMAAGRVLFNSAYHCRSLFAALPNFLKHFPDFNELDTLPLLREKCEVLPVGLELAQLDTSRPHLFKQEQGETGPPPLILWNQRWEYDKNPAAFFQALYAVAEQGVPFRLALCGERFRRRPGEFEEAQQRLHERIIHVGYAEPEQYRALLWEAEITISTAHHEFFGISILEAIYCHTFPLLPNRLSYPELIPDRFHNQCLYENERELIEGLHWALTHRAQAREVAARLAQHVTSFGWEVLAPQYDRKLAQIIREQKRQEKR
jgi:glycosyltransferase involved in cell wall biosynthesis